MLANIRARISSWFDHSSFDQSNDERLARARGIKVIDDRSFSELMGIFDPKSDGENPDWLNLVALAYDSPDHKLHDGKTAHGLLLKAAKLGSAPAAYNLGTRWLHGYYDKVDVNRAKYWYRRAFEDGHGCAGASYASLELNDPTRPANSPAKRAALEVLDRSEREYGGPWAVFYKAQLHASGFFGTRDGKEVISRYYRLTRAEVCGPPRAMATQALAFHNFLGIFFQRPEPEKALAHIDDYPRDEREWWARHGAANSLDRLKHIIATEIIPHREAERQQGKNDLTLPPPHEYAYDLIKSLIDGKRSVAEVSNDLQTGAIPRTRVLADWLWAASTLANIEGDANAEAWNSLRIIVETRLKGASAKRAHATTLDFGLCYNRTTDTGRPIPGAIINPTIDGPPVIGDTYPSASRNQPNSWGKIKGIKGCADGTVVLIQEASASSQPAYLIRQDFAVALMLAFGQKNGPVWPSLSIESIDQETPERPRWSLQQKMWTPEWIGRSEFGKTLYGTDYWAGEIAFHPHTIHISDKYDALAGISAKLLIREIASAGGRKDGLFGRIMLRPDNINWTWSDDQEGSLVCNIHRVRMRVDGSEITITSDGVEDRSLHLNDGRFSSGRVANLMTEHYDTIAELWPMFERLRQLNGLMSSVAELRKRGFRPSDELLTWANEETSELRDRPPLQLYQRLVL